MNATWVATTPIRRARAPGAAPAVMIRPITIAQLALVTAVMAEDVAFMLASRSSPTELVSLIATRKQVSAVPGSREVAATKPPEAKAQSR